MNLWIKRALGAAALGGGLLAAATTTTTTIAGVAGAQEVSADVSARLGRPTATEVRVCADGRVLSRLLGSCHQAGSGTTGTVQADPASGVRVRARVPRPASADVSIGTRRSRPRATVSADASAATRSRAATADADAGADTSPRANTDAAASLSRPRAGRLLDLDAAVSLAGVGMLGSSPFTLVGDPAGDPLLAIGDLTLADVAGQAPAGIGVLDTGPIASGNQATVDVGDVSPSVPVAVCGNSDGVLGDASASCTPAQPAPDGPSASGPSAATSTGPARTDDRTLLGNLASGKQVDASIGDISPSVPVTVCGNGVGALGDAWASCGAAQPAAGSGTSAGSGSSGSAGSSIDSSGVSATTGSLLDGAASGSQVDAGIASISPSVPVAVCGNGVGALGDASAACAADTSTGGTTAPPPGTTDPGGSTDTDGTQGTPGSTGTSGIPGTTGLTPGTDGGAGDPITTFSPLRPSVADSSLPFTGAAGDLLALVAAGLLAAGVLIVRAARPAAAATEGGEDR